MNWMRKLCSVRLDIDLTKILPEQTLNFVSCRLVFSLNMREKNFFKHFQLLHTLIPHFTINGAYASSGGFEELATYP